VWDTERLALAKFPPLTADIEADVVVIGGGVAGLATALRLLEPGSTAAGAAGTAGSASPPRPPPPSVVVLEALVRGGGMTARSTAHAMQWCDNYYGRVDSAFGAEGAKSAAASMDFAVGRVGELAEAAGGAGFTRATGYLVPADKPGVGSSAALAGEGTGDDAKQRAVLERELAACVRAGVRGVEMVDLGGGAEVGGARLALRFPHSAQVDPVALADGLADAVVAAGGRIYEGTRALSGGLLGGGGGGGGWLGGGGGSAGCGGAGGGGGGGASPPSAGEVRTMSGFVARARLAVVKATCSPCDRNILVHARQHPYRTFAVALEIPDDAGAFAEGGDEGGGGGGGEDGNAREAALFWSTAEPYHNVRTAPLPQRPGRRALIVGGAAVAAGALGSARTAAADRAGDGPYQRLEAWARARWPACGAVLHRWTGIVFEPSDYLGVYGLEPTPLLQTGAAKPGASAPAGSAATAAIATAAPPASASSSGGAGPAAPATANASTTSTSPDVKTYILTGDSGQGITGAAIGSEIVARSILGLAAPDWAAVYSPSRVAPLLHAPGVALQDSAATASGLARALPLVGGSRGGSFGGAPAGLFASLRRATADAVTALVPGAFERAEAMLAPGEGAVLQAPLWRAVAGAAGARPGGGAGGSIVGRARRGLLSAKVASWRDPATGLVSRRSALCTHMGCALSWNALDESFDCGCHGSAFSGDGRVCSGPAVADLEDLGGR